jgi:hypothetical protein
MKTTRHVSDNTEDFVTRVDNSTSEVIQGQGYYVQDQLRVRMTNTGNGFIAYFPSHRSTHQDYYICMDYAQARDMVLGLSAFKNELGFK